MSIFAPQILKLPASARVAVYLRSANFSTSICLRKDPRLADMGRVLKDEYAVMRDEYTAPKNPIILAHGLLGFDEIHLAGAKLPGIQYWRGIREALERKNIEVIIATVPASSSIEKRAARLAESIAEKAHGKSVNIVAHSMRGLDARYMISQLKPPNVRVLSLTTIATPHHGSAFADHMFESIGPSMVPKLYKALEYIGLETEAFSQLTRKYMEENYNPKTPDVEGIKYYSYGATLEPAYWSVFRYSHNVIKKLENAPNDGLVSVPSSKWGEYKGTLVGVSHLDLINWTNRLKWLFWQLTGTTHNFNAVAFYLDIADMLAKEGL
ncbi:putative triacylglycerol lipase [Tothia fuscella]|uniref:Triacylglycerol lipase n=1 Tax=Tothia fuscella TaxID=1048955 RepID=A0A9P4NEG4_9PEZI|nr:putative triacylglycerol lipase [Tothia fuscella]